MRAPTREVDVEEFVAHVETGLEAWEYVKDYVCRPEMIQIRDTDPVAEAPTDLPDLEPEPDDEPLC